MADGIAWYSPRNLFDWTQVTAEPKHKWTYTDGSLTVQEETKSMSPWIGGAVEWFFKSDRVGTQDVPSLGKRIKTRVEFASRFAKWCEVPLQVFELALLLNVCKYGSVGRSFFLVVKGVQYLAVPLWRTDEIKVQTYGFKYACPIFMILNGSIGLIAFYEKMAGFKMASHIANWSSWTQYCGVVGAATSTAFMATNVAVSKYRLWSAEKRLEGKDLTDKPAGSDISHGDFVSKTQKQLAGDFVDFMKFGVDFVVAVNRSTPLMTDEQFKVFAMVGYTWSVLKSLMELHKPTSEWVGATYRSLPTVLSKF